MQSVPNQLNLCCKETQVTDRNVLAICLVYKLDSGLQTAIIFASLFECDSSQSELSPDWDCLELGSLSSDDLSSCFVIKSGHPEVLVVAPSVWATISYKCPILTLVWLNH